MLTPGQVAYEAYMLEMMNTHPAGSERWHVLEARVRDAWEAAAQAVLARGQAQPRMETPHA